MSGRRNILTGDSQTNDHGESDEQLQASDWQFFHSEFYMRVKIRSDLTTNKNV